MTAVNDEARPEPFDQLLRSHRRLEERLADLKTAVRAPELDEVAVRDVSEFLARQVQRHEQDEEKSLFPRLARVPELDGVLAQIAEEHAAHHALHERLERIVRAFDFAKPTAEHRAELVVVADALEDAYRTHIDVEEAVVFPAARKALDPRDLAAIAEEMQARRGGGGRRGDRR